MVRSRASVQLTLTDQSPSAYSPPAVFTVQLTLAVWLEDPYIMTIHQSLRSICSKMSLKTHVKTIQADGVNVFYREAGSTSAPTILLLHGYPSSSFQYRNLIPILATKYHVLAPDMPGFGFTDVPEGRNYEYTFGSFAITIGAFVDALKINKFAIYIFDYGAPTGLRLALDRPDSITAIIAQNGNAYEEGLGEVWTPVKAYWAQNTKEKRDGIQSFISFEGIKGQYLHGVPHPESVPPETYHLDYYAISRPGNSEIQLDVFYDYRNNVALYPKFQAYFRERNPPILAIWGKNDIVFPPAGAEAYKKDSPQVEIKLLNTGHFALETHCEEIGSEMLRFLSKHGI